MSYTRSDQSMPAPLCGVRQQAMLSVNAIYRWLTMRTAITRQTMCSQAEAELPIGSMQQWLTFTQVEDMYCGERTKERD